jgi:DNA-binding transcriptional LysR family regulator
MHLGSTEAVKHAVKAGLGVSLVMAAAVTQECRNRTLSAIPIVDEPPRKDIYVVQRENYLRDAPAQRFADFLLRGPHAVAIPHLPAG